MFEKRGLIIGLRLCEVGHQIRLEGRSQDLNKNKLIVLSVCRAIFEISATLKTVDSLFL